MGEFENQHGSSGELSLEGTEDEGNAPLPIDLPPHLVEEETTYRPNIRIRANKPSLETTFLG